MPTRMRNRFSNGLMHGTLLKRSRQLRNEPTPAEVRLWSHLRLKNLDGPRFRRQYPIEGYIVDADAKAAAVERIGSALTKDDGLIAALGDGANDLPMLARADVSFAYRAKPVVRAKATYVIDHCGLDAILNLFH